MTNTKKMRVFLTDAAKTALTMAKTYRGTASMATDPESHTSTIEAAYQQIGIAIAYQMIANRYHHIDEKATYDVVEDLQALATTAQLQADAAQEIGTYDQKVTYQTTAEGYWQIADLVERGQWQEEER